MAATGPVQNVRTETRNSDDAEAAVEAVFSVFYRTIRAGQVRLAGGGGPFGFDVTTALIVDSLITAYDCDALVETGCHLGDTTAYLGRRYPGIPVLTCDIDPESAAFTKNRVRALGNVTVSCQDSPALVAAAAGSFERPLFYLDAHWGRWPLHEELAAVRAGIVMVDDFDVGHPRFAFDEYDGVRCGPTILSAMPNPPTLYFTPDPNASYPLPCLQTGRRAGVGIIAIGLATGPLQDHPYLTAHSLMTEAAVMA